MKELFAMLPLLKDIKTSRQAALKRLKEYNSGKNDLIDSITFNNNLSGMPYSNTGETSDKTGDAAAIICSNMHGRTNLQDIKEITGEIYTIDSVIDCVEIGLKLIPPIQKELLILKYWENKTWKEIEEHLKSKGRFYSNSQARRIVNKGLHKMTIMSMIDIETYKQAKKLCE